MDFGLWAYNVIPFLIILALHVGLVVFIARRFRLRVLLPRLALLTVITMTLWFFVAYFVTLSLALCSQCDAFDKARPVYYMTVGLPFFLCSEASSGLLHALPYLGIPGCEAYSLLFVGLLLFGASIAISVPIQRGQSKRGAK